MISVSLQRLVDKEKITVYCGADPSAVSLHMGNLIPLMVLLHFYIRGHNVIPLVGGATGEVGDPSGRSTERQKMESDVRNNNVANIQLQLRTFLERGKAYAEARGYSTFGTVNSRNNADWWRDVKMLDFLATYGPHIRVGHMLARDSVKNRIRTEQGLGFNEFAYQILQAYDFWHLHSVEGCRVQVGGSDQWGNITAGIDLISRLRSAAGKKNTLPKVSSGEDAVYGLTVPLLTTPNGEKFGKSAGNAVWINPDMTKPYELYQFFVRSPDKVVFDYLKMFTLLPTESIIDIMTEHEKNTSIRIAQKVLAREVTDLVHGMGAGARAKVMSGIMFPSDELFSSDEVLSVFRKENLLHTLNKSEVVGASWRDVIAQLTNKSKCKFLLLLVLFFPVTNSKLAEIGRLIKGGGVYHGVKRSQIKTDTIADSDLIGGKLLMVRVGKASYHVAEVV